jgi:hypothetical protein
MLFIKGTPIIEPLTIQQLGHPPGRVGECSQRIRKATPNIVVATTVIVRAFGQ